MQNQKTKIGVFDSGIGGLSFVHAIQKELPEHAVIFKNDSAHIPYGTKSLPEIYGYTKPILLGLVEEGCSVIVIACNTVTTNFIERLRKEISVPLIGVEPMVKPASAASDSGIIAVCATPRTLESQRYHWLKSEYAKGLKVLEPDCSGWALMVETNRVDREKIAKTVEGLLDQGADQIVLGCTHYHWIEEIIKDIASGRAAVIQPEKPVVEQLKKVLKQLA